MASNPYAVLKPVSSSMFSRAGYDDASWCLLLEFKSTKEVREYPNVDPSVADEFLSSESLGKWWNKNIKGNPDNWPYEVLGVDPTVLPPAPRQDVPDSTEVIDDDIRLVDPGWDGKTIISTPLVVEPQMNFEVKGFVEDNNLPMMHISEIADFPKDAGFIIDEEFEEVEETAIATQPKGEVLSAWQPPKTPVEAITLLNERSGEIDAIIRQNTETGQQALTVRVSTPESSTEASETLTRLVSKRDTTFALIDPLRAKLYEAYTEAGEKVKSSLAPLDNGVKHVKAQILAYNAAVERIRQQKIREDQEARDAEARRLQEVESQRLTLAEIGDKLEQGDEKGAQMLFEAPIEVPRPYVPPTYYAPAAPKVEGQSSSTTWKIDRELVESDKDGAAYVASITKLLRAIKDGSYPIDQAATLLSWDFTIADKRAGSMMAAFNVPGLTAIPVTTLRVSRGKKK